MYLKLDSTFPHINWFDVPLQAILRNSDHGLMLTIVLSFNRDFFLFVIIISSYI